MLKRNLVISLLALSLFSIQTYAFKVTVQSKSSTVSALGYTVNGKKFGKPGHEYIGEGKSGVYIFGVRVGGLLGTDVRCYTADGKAKLPLKKSTRATLTYSNKKCVVKLT